MKTMLTSLSVAIISVNSFATNIETNYNTVDLNGMKQGMWKVSLANGYEVGKFMNDEKEGLWLTYSANGNVVSELTYVAGEIRGDYKTYFSNGQIQEMGQWVNKKNKGEFFRYFENGSLHQHFQFNAEGKRSGFQRTYFENGQLAIEVNVENGLEQGICARYDKKGNLVAETVFENGVAIATEGELFGEALESGAGVEVDAELVTNEATPFSPNSANVLYDANGNVAVSGIFKNGKLFDGKIFHYNESGTLDHVEVYKRGKHIGLAHVTKASL